MVLAKAKGLERGVVVSAFALGVVLLSIVLTVLAVLLAAVVSLYLAVCLAVWWLVVLWAVLILVLIVLLTARVALWLFFVVSVSVFARAALRYSESETLEYPTQTAGDRRKSLHARDWKKWNLNWRRWLW